jgi:hypothetical protein
MSGADDGGGRVPAAFLLGRPGRWPGGRTVDRVLRACTGTGLHPAADQVRAVTDGLFAADPLAERFADEVLDRPGGRAMLDAALGPGGVATVPDAPEAMRELFAGFERTPDWVRPELVERGAAVWRRWGTMLFAVAGSTTLEMYTEAAVATPLSLAGGYAGDNARRRFFETVRFWIDVSEPGALFTPGSAGRSTALRVRVMHVAVRRRVAGHPEWDEDRWGVPISRTWQMMTLLGGSVAPALALWPLGHLTSPAEMRALLHFQRYLGHLLGVEPRWYPETVSDAVRLLLLVLDARSRDSGAHGAELIESFPAGFAPAPGLAGADRLRSVYTHGVHAGYAWLWTARRTWRAHRMPSPLPWIAVPLLRAPFVAAAELAGHLLPPVRRALERRGARHRERWYARYARGHVAAYEATSGLRR